MHLPSLVVSSTSSWSVQVCTPTMPSPASSFIAILPLRLMLAKSDSTLRRTSPDLVANTTFSFSHSASSSGSGRMVVMRFAFRQRQQIHHRLAPALDAGLGQPPDLQLVGHAGGREEHQRRMRDGDEEMGDVILFARRHAGAAFAAAALHAIFGDRRALDVAGMGDGDRDILALDQRFVFDLDIGIDQFGQPRSCEFVSIAPSSSRMIGSTRGRDAQDFEIFRDRLAELRHLVADLVAAERGQPLQAQIEDGLGLLLRQADRAVFGIAWRGSAISAISGPTSFAGQSRAINCSRAVAASGAARISAITSSILATATARPTKMCPRSRALVRSKRVRRVTTSSRKVTKRRDHILEVHQQRPAVVQRQHVDAEARLQFGEAIELVQHDIATMHRASARSPRACRGGRSRRGYRRCLRCACRAPSRRCVPAGAPCSPDREAR